MIVAIIVGSVLGVVLTLAYYGLRRIFEKDPRVMTRIERPLVLCLMLALLAVRPFCSVIDRIWRSACR